ncbi:MAG: S41 family peptidase [Tenacibaculum sp.]
MKIYKLVLFFGFFLILFSCSEKDDTPTDIEVQSFVWKGLNAYYLWQENIPDLSDSRFNSDQQLYDYLSNFNDPASLFESLLYQRSSIDKWSLIVDDYNALEQTLEGTTQTTGMEFGLNRYKNDPTNVFGHVRYVIPGTDAVVKGITRGMIFTKVDGVQLTDQNFRNLLFSNASSFTITLADFNDGNPLENNTTITLNKSTYTEKPIYIAKTFTKGTKKIGYLMYNAFISNSDSELNQAFAVFKSDMVTDLIVDLRYNSGGSVNTAVRLGSMITGQFTDEVFAKHLFNSKITNSLSQEIQIEKFTDKIGNNIAINSLELDEVYFIISNSSASASELLINCLTPYIDVKTVGDTTTGKYVGSVLLYDSPDFQRESVNPNHTWAMLPIIIESVNKNNENQKQGISPNTSLLEDYGNLGVLGEESEPLLAKTIDLITTKSRSAKFASPLPYRFETIGSSKSNLPTHNNMYISR